MKIEPILHQLFALLLAQPTRLASSRLSASLLPGVFSRLLIAMRKLHFDGERPTVTAIITSNPTDKEVGELASQLADMGEPEISFERMLELIEDNYLRQRIGALASKFYDRSFDAKDDPRKILSELRVEAFNIDTNTNNRSTTAGGDTRDVQDKIDWIQSNPGCLRGPSLGFPRLDRLLNGLTPRYYIVGARPSVGKTSLLGDLQTALCEQTIPSAMFSLEMPAVEYKERLVAAVSGVNISNYRSMPFTFDELKALAKARREISAWQFFISDDPEQTIDDICSELVRLYHECGVRAAFIDYIQYIRLTGKMDRWEEIGINSQKLKGVTKKLKIPLVVAAQLKRVENKFSAKEQRTIHRAPELQDLRESGNLEQDADVVALLDRDWIHDPTSAQIIIAKHRGGATHPGVKLIYEREITKFKEAP